MGGFNWSSELIERENCVVPAFLSFQWENTASFIDREALLLGECCLPSSEGLFFGIFHEDFYREIRTDHNRHRIFQLWKVERRKMGKIWWEWRMGRVLQTTWPENARILGFSWGWKRFLRFGVKNGRRGFRVWNGKMNQKWREARENGEMRRTEAFPNNNQGRDENNGVGLVGNPLTSSDERSKSNWNWLFPTWCVFSFPFLGACRKYQHTHGRDAVWRKILWNPPLCRGEDVDDPTLTFGFVIFSLFLLFCSNFLRKRCCSPFFHTIVKESLISQVTNISFFIDYLFRLSFLRFSNFPVRKAIK